MVDAVVDLFNLKAEDDRIRLIGETALAGQTVGIILEKDEPEKIERYVVKITTRYPTVVVLNRIDGPTKDTVTIKFGPRHN